MSDREQLQVAESGLTVVSAGYVMLRPVEMTDRTKGWIAEDARRPGCTGYGETEQEARESLSRATIAYDRAAREGSEGETGELFDRGSDPGGRPGDPWTRSIAPTGAQLTGA